MTIRAALLTKSLSVALLGALLAGCAAPPPAVPTPQAQVPTVEPTPTQAAAPKRLVMRTLTDPDNLDPHLATASLTRRIMLNVFEGLVKPTPEGGVTPAVASSYAASEDGQTYTFTLREGIKFHNGQPVTVADVKYSCGAGVLLAGKRSATTPLDIC
ncbi:MAG: ABC transporter substrate-binding protein [Anaerolineae bacterium]|nr:ABC transporter substrate-binding protein [Thermoflexales bacterium]MDW8396464.1 ABC transporter substrate-binding protein [Anaerolineae bacterium]